MSRALTEAGRAGSGLRDADFWYGKASQMLAPHLFAAGANGYRMADVLRWVKTQEKFEVRSLLQATGVEEALVAAESGWQIEDRARSSTYTTLEEALRVFDNPSAVKSADVGGFRISDFCNGQPNTAYLCAPPDTQEEYAPMFTALVRSVLRECYVRNMDYVDGRDEASGPPVPMLVLLDEAANITPLENLATLSTTAAGTGIQLIMVFHDISQITALYGEPMARSISNNCSAFVVLPGNRDPSTARLVEEMLGGDQVSGMVDRKISSSGLRKLGPRSALCVYENLAPIVLGLRSSFQDAELVSLKSTGA